jgi:hypothetical protein
MVVRLREERTFDRAPDFVRTVRSLESPDPSWPWPPCPHACTTPLRVIVTVCALPALTCRLPAAVPEATDHRTHSLCRSVVVLPLWPLPFISNLVWRMFLAVSSTRHRSSLLSASVLCQKRLQHSAILTNSTGSNNARNCSSTFVGRSSRADPVGSIAACLAEPAEAAPRPEARRFS